MEIWETIPSQMKAAQLNEIGQPYRLVTTAVPQIRDHELLVKVRAAGFCHSDYQVVKGEADCKLPLIPSHEGVGGVIEIGEECTGSWKVGDRVGALNSKNACSHCPSCHFLHRSRGKLDPRFCERRETAGFKHDGCFAEYMVVDPVAAVPLPDSLSYEQAAPLMCAGATVWGALEKATSDIEPGAAVAIVGIGGLGHLGVQFCKALDYRTIAIDNREAARNLASSNTSLLPDLVVDSAKADAATQIFNYTHGEGVAAAVVCTDSVEANSWALRLLRVGGTMIALGLPPDYWRFDPSLLVFRELVIKGSYVANRDSAVRMMEVVKKYGISSHLTCVGFDEIPKVIGMYEDKNLVGRIVIQISDGK